MTVAIEPETLADQDAVLALYRAVAATPGGLAREQGEIGPDYVRSFVTRALAGGVCLVARDGDPVVGEIHCGPLGPKVFAHVLGDLTIAVHPDQQGKGVGRALFEALLGVVEQVRPEISRVELLARESNQKALAFYETLGFVREGRFEGRIRGVGGGLEADIPMAWLRARR